MKFGQSAEEAANDQRGTTSAYMKYFKDGDTVVHLLQEPNEWVYFWDHYDPSGFSYPCTNDRNTCPGCTSTNERIKRASRKIAFNLIEGDFVNVYKVPPLLADKLKLRYERIGTVTDREYTITRYQTGTGEKKKTEYDVDGGPENKIDPSKYELRDIEEMLAEQYDEIWGDSKKVAAARRKQDDAQQELNLKERLAQRQKEQSEDPPSEPSAKSDQAEGQYSEHYLRSLGFPSLVALLVKEGTEIPDHLSSTDEVVDWIMSKQ